MNNQLIGRVGEQKVLQETMTTNKAELIALIGHTFIPLRIYLRAKKKR